MAEQQTGQTLPVHGQRQRAVPHCHLPLIAHRFQTGMDPPPPHLYHRVPKLLGRKIQQNPRHWCFRKQRDLAREGYFE